MIQLVILNLDGFFDGPSGLFDGPTGYFWMLEVSQFDGPSGPFHGPTGLFSQN